MLEQKALYITIILFVSLVFVMITKCKVPISLVDDNTIQKRIDLYYLPLIFLFWVLAISIKDSADLSIYRWAYEDRISHGKEPLFDAIQFFFHDIGWGFDSFKRLWVSVITILLCVGIRQYSYYPSKVLALALITVLTGFITQMRSALVGTVFINAFPLILTGKKRDKILYFIIIILAAQVHIVGYCFLIFLIINKNNNRTFGIIYYVAIAIGTLIALFSSTFVFSTISKLINIVSLGGVGSTRALSYFSGETSHFRYAFFLMCKYLFLFLLTDKACKLKINESINVPKKQMRFFMIQKANALMLIFLPITMLSASFERLFFYFTIIQYAMIFNVKKHDGKLIKEINWKLFLQSAMVIGILLVTFVQWYFSPDDMIRILNSI